ncbi:hypothetical protein HFO71_10400 [Rhizobium laguerreae]|uniref:hypothetical protein n=1 Tax=Rhizobium laguerreae TaxID=1076926 RepID=UPI001C91EA29|nr:hypothetical protein [Rhizobium laguerreae]MBY3070751.1 hypothetical protein [Rhizobium laguerreae]
MDTETLKIDCPANVWTKVADEHQSIYIQNQERKALRFFFGWEQPATDADAYIVSQDYNPSEKLFSFGNAKTGLWVMPDGDSGASVVVVRTRSVELVKDPTLVRTVNAPTYTLNNDDWGYVLDFTQGTIITVPAELNARFNCALRQGGDDQFEVVAGSGAVVEEIDDHFKSEQRLALLTLCRFPDGKFQIIGRTAA